MGKLIVFEGIDGSGKSTQFKLICRRMTDEGRGFMRVAFPQYNEPSSALIKMYLAGEFGEKPGDVNAYAASSFFAVDRYASYMKVWREYYLSGGLIITDRYTTSNAIHQGAKLPENERGAFFKWLYDYEFNLLGLPAPDMVLYMDIETDEAVRRLRRREAETSSEADIHEKDLSYLSSCQRAGAEAAAYYGWNAISCIKNEKPRSESEIHEEIYRLITG